MNFIGSTLNTSFKIQGVKRTEQLEIPIEAVREIVINAIVHRNYHISSPIKIAVYDNRIEVFSPGSFPGPIAPAYDNRGMSYTRNSIISRLFREAGYIEKLGSGFITVFDSYNRAGLTKPQIIEGGNFIKCILPRRSEYKLSELYGNTERLAFYIAEKNIWTASDVQVRLGVSRSSATRCLADLVRAGILTRIGLGPATKYHLNR
jgi:ATP-dependent DNA helicase RecG